MSQSNIQQRSSDSTQELGDETFMSATELRNYMMRTEMSQMKPGPRPTAPPWTPAEDEQLLALLDSRMDKNLIARRLKRTVHAVLTRKYVLNKRRLVELGLKVKAK